MHFYGKFSYKIATENQFTWHCVIFQRPTDTRCFLPFLSSFEKQLGGLPDYIVADAGYGGEKNYKYLLEENDSLPIMPYTVKALLGFTRFRLRGLPKVATEANLYFMANNMRKLARLACPKGKNTYQKSEIRFLIRTFHLLFEEDVLPKRLLLNF
ncbi:hypothetical protein [Listeria rocourtiae]|uniref:hypothetical protein n=1 Tax=Listeria rocourtiae TaxID=647910 RepID=UPI003D2F5B8B